MSESVAKPAASVSAGAVSNDVDVMGLAGITEPAGPAEVAGLAGAPEPTGLTDPTGPVTPAELPRISRWGIALLLAATFGGGMAAIVPMSYSLTVRIEQIAPGRVEALGLILGIGSIFTLVTAPLTGILSDRTRSRWGRRRPFTVLGMALGIISVPVMAFAPNLTVLTLGWILSTAGWNTASGSIGNWQADKLPPSQRGSISGLTGFMMQIAPVLGIIMVGPLHAHIVLVFVAPATVGLVLISLFVVFAHEEDSRGLARQGSLTFGTLIRSYGFPIRRYRDFSWNWLGRFVFFLGLTSTTSFSVYFYAQRLDITVGEVASILALTSGLSIITATLGSIGGGWISDSTGRRKPLMLVGAAFFAAGCVVMMFAYDLPALICGSLLNSLGIAVFSAVGQALVLDILPERDTQAGRYMAINLFAQKIPGVLAPVGAPLLLAIGGGAGVGEQNFTVLYLVSSVLALLGALVILLGVKGAK